MKESIKTICGWAVFITIVLFALGIFTDDSKKIQEDTSSITNTIKENYSPSNLHEDLNNYPTYVDDNYIYDHDEEVQDYKEKPDGTYTVEACSQNSGNCYDLDADISDGEVERIYFSNGGHLDLDGAELDESGDASGESFTIGEGYNNDAWDIHCDDCE